MAFLLRVVQDPATSQWPALTSSYEGSYSGHSYAAESKNPFEKQTNTKAQWNTWQVSLFYSFPIPEQTFRFNVF